MSIAPLLMFTGQASEAMAFYVATFPNSALGRVTRYEAGEDGPAGTVKHATFTLAGRDFACIDSPVTHAFTFTPSLSLQVTCDSEDAVDSAFTALAEGGQVLMPLGAYPFSRRFGWVTDRFGVSWQVTLETP